MTMEEYELLPFQPGWKVEYWDGCAHFTPRYQPVITAFKVEPRAFTSPLHIRPAEPSDEEPLVGPYASSFGETIEYCDFTPQQVESAARRALRGHFGGDRGEPHPSSKVAVALDHSETVIGAALLVTGEFGVMLDLLFVAPAYQRHGAATALVSAAVNDLHRLGCPTLTSRYHIGNDQSRNWHQRFGFVEVPDLTIARLNDRAARQELSRREKLGDLAPKERKKLAAEVERWRKEVRELERREAEEGFEAVRPNLRWW